MSDAQVNKKVTLEGRIIKADGTVIELGTLASSDPAEAAAVGGTVTIEEAEEPPFLAIPKQLYRRVKTRFNKE